jgi:hypothetical protein
MDRSAVLAHIWSAYDAGELIPICAWCGSVRIEAEWIAPPVGALSMIDERMTLSHSICPKCATRPAPKND